MRCLTTNELLKVAGGVATNPADAPTLPGSNVIGYYSGPPPGFSSWWEWSNAMYGAIGGGGGGGGGGSGIGGGDGGGGHSGGPSAIEQEFENGVEAAADLAAEGELDSSLAHNLFVISDYAKIALDIGATQFQYAIDSYKSFEKWGGNSMEVPHYDEYIHWDRVNWNAYDDGGNASPAQALQNMLHDLDVNHHVAMTKQSTWSS